MESLARSRLLFSWHSASRPHAANLESPLYSSVRILPGVRVQSNRRVGARHDSGSLVAEHHNGYRRSAAFFDRVLGDPGWHIRRARASYRHRVTYTAPPRRFRTCSSRKRITSMRAERDSIHHRGQAALLLRLLGCATGTSTSLCYYANKRGAPAWSGPSRRLEGAL